VNEHRHFEIARREHCCDVRQVLPDFIAALSIVRDDLDRAAIRE